MTVKSRASSAISSSLRSRGMSIVPSEISTCERRFSVSQRRYSSSLPAGDDRLEERAAADDGRLERAVEGDLLLEVLRDVRRAPAELDDVDVVAGRVEEASMSRRFSPLSMTCVRPLVRGFGERAGRSRSRRGRG